MYNTPYLTIHRHLHISPYITTAPTHHSNNFTSSPPRNTQPGSDDAIVEKNKSKGSLSNVLQNILSKRPTTKHGSSTMVMAKAKTERQIMASKKDAQQSQSEDSDELVGGGLHMTNIFYVI